ncbi:MAG: transporter substrate-binding domain-containing protein [Oscillospiraceae bacterium]
MNQKRALCLLIGAVMLCSSMTACAKKKSIEKSSDLAGETIACLNDSAGVVYADGIQQSTVLSFNNGLEAVQAVQNGQASAVIMDEVSAQIYTTHNSDVKILEQPIGTESYVIAYKKGSEKFGSLLGEALSSLQAEGKIDEIISHWVGDSADHASYVPAEQNPRGELIMATVPNLPPFAESEGSAVIGIEPDVMRAVCDKMGMTLTIMEMQTSEDVLEAVKSGKADVGLSRIAVQKDNINKASFTDSYFASNQVIVVQN